MDNPVNDLALLGFAEFLTGDFFEVHRVFPQKLKLSFKLLILLPDLLKVDLEICAAGFKALDLHHARGQQHRENQ